MSIWDVSIELANKVYILAYIALVVGAIMTAAATISLFWASAVRDKHSDGMIATAQEGAAKANERASALESQTAELQKQTAEANLQAEQERLARAKIEDRLDRSIRGGPPEWEAAIAKLKKFSGQKVNLITYPGDREIETLARSIGGMLTQAGWIISTPRGGKYDTPIFDIAVEVQGDAPTNIPASRDVEAADAWLQENRIWVGGPMGLMPGEASVAGTLELNPDAKINVVIGKRR
jgi:hypothetical protein